MSTDVPVTPKYRSLAEVIERVGVTPDRIRNDPQPGTATEEDLARLRASEDRLFELVDGILVEKTVGFSESVLAGWILYLLRQFLSDHRSGIVTTADGSIRLMGGLVRVPDVAFFGWDSLPDRRVPTEAIPDLVPNLAIEVLSVSNTRTEMQIKLKEYFLAGTKLVWLVDPRKRTVAVHTAPDQSVELNGDQELDGGDVLVGFRVSVSAIFAELDQHG